METLVAWLSSTATVLTCAFLVGELKRTRGFSPSSKRAKLDDETTSSSHPVAPESVPETETSEASSASGDDPNPSLIALDSPTNLFENIMEKWKDLLEASGLALPVEWSLPEFAREEAMQDPADLARILADLLQHGSQSWYWLEATELLSLITSI